MMMRSAQVLSTTNALASKVLDVGATDDAYEQHKQQFGRRLKERREAAGLSQMGLARLLPGGTDVSQVSRWERGLTFPEFGTLVALARVFEVSAGWLEWGDDEHG